MRLSIILLLLFAPPALCADAAPTKTAAERAWPSFHATFRDAVGRRDRKALRKMMASDFDYSSGGGSNANGDGETRDDAFKYWDERRGRGWKTFERLLLGGAVTRKGLHHTTARRK